MLLAAGANINAANREGTTALKQACQHGHAHVVRVLLNAGARLETKSERVANYKRFDSECRKKHEAWGDAIKEADAHLNTALKIAIDRNHYGVVRLLLAAGARITRKTRACASDRPSIKPLLDDAKRIRTRHLLKKWKTACRVWCMTRAWWMSACERSYAPDMPGAKRARAEFEAACAA
jgi:hypothetical protein